MIIEDHEYMKIASSEHVVYSNCFLFLFWHLEQFMYITCSELAIAIFMYWTWNSMNNLLSCFGLVDARISASENIYLYQISRMYTSISEFQFNRNILFHLDIFSLLMKCFLYFVTRFFIFFSVLLENHICFSLCWSRHL